MIGAAGLQAAELLTLRQILWRFDGWRYWQEIESARVVAGVFNSRRRRSADKFFQWVDFHSRHNGRRPLATVEPASGKSVVGAALAAWAPGMKFLPGYDPTAFFAG